MSGEAPRVEGGGWRKEARDSTLCPRPSTLVVKVGGRAQSDPALIRALAAAWAAAPGSLVVVHGGGDEVSALQRALGVAPTFVGGRRVTSADDIDVLRMALSGSANKRLVSALVSRGLPAVGLSGEDAALLTAAPLDPERLGCVGDPRQVNVALLRHLLGGGYLPVVSPLSRSEAAAAADSVALNVNGDDA
ncbi:MAG: acetylglutamate kinase, partial [Gemmatimonadota bacterium]|nr:acetylglutamate kinase [Gemmatimonadota bacterium]